jgi:hypothetical protein
VKQFHHVIIMACIWIGLIAAPAWAAPNVTVTARVANEGRVRPGGWTTVLVDLANQGAEVSGELTVEPTQGPWESHPQFVVPLSLPAGGKKLVPVNVPLQGMGQLKVTLTAEGKVVHAETLSLTTLAPQSLLIGVLSDDDLGIPALAALGAGKPGGNAQVARLAADTLPNQAALLKGFDVIALSRFDSASLSKEQLQALEVWVGQGGTLLLGGGPEWKRTLAPLPPSLVPVEVTGTGNADMTPLSNLSDKPLAGTAPVSQARVLRGMALSKAGDLPLVVRDQVGLGQVIFLAADPGLAPLVSWEGQTALFERVIGARADRSQFEDWQGTDANMESALRRIPGLGLPSLWLIAGLLGGYLLLIGPVNYLTLKRLDRRGLAWVTVPVMSAAFVGAIYLLGFGGHSAMLAHLITVTELAPGTHAATQTAYVGVYAPSVNHLEVPLENTRLVKPLYIYNASMENQAPTRIVAGDKTTVELRNLNDYSMAGFSMVQDLAAGAGIQLADLTLNAGGQLTARVVNQLDQPLTDVRVTAGMTTQMIGRLEPGATSEPVTLELFMAGDGDPTMRMKMMERGVVYGPDSDPNEVRRNMMVDALLAPNYRNFSTREIKVVGFTPDPMAKVGLPAMGRLIQGNNLVYASLPIPTLTAAGDLPPGVVQGVMDETGKSWGTMPQGYMLDSGTFTFNLYLPPMDLARISEMNLHIQKFTGGTFGLAVKNQQTGAWVDLKSEAVQPLPNWTELLGQGDVITVKIDVTNQIEMAPPTISAKGGAR